VPPSLWQWLLRLADPRDPRGVRFSVACVIATALAARLAGCDSFTAIGEWAAGRPQRVLKALGCPLHKKAGVYIAPSEKTVRRISGLVDHDVAGDLLCGWTAELAAACEILTPAQLQKRRRDTARKARARARKADKKAHAARTRSAKLARKAVAASPASFGASIRRTIRNSSPRSSASAALARYRPATSPVPSSAANNA